MCFISPTLEKLSEPIKQNLGAQHMNNEKTILAEISGEDPAFVSYATKFLAAEPAIGVRTLRHLFSYGATIDGYRAFMNKNEGVKHD
jgi:hypothetical protein